MLIRTALCATALIVAFAAGSIGSGDQSSARLDGFLLGSASAAETSRLESFTPAAAIPAERQAALQERDLKAQRLSGREIVIAPDLYAYVQQILDRLLAISPDPGLRARLIIAAHPDIIAYANPGGLIVVGFEFLERFGANEDALAFVLAHELSHLLYRHAEADWVVDMQGEFAFAAGLVNDIDRQLGGAGQLTPQAALGGGLRDTDRVALAARAADVAASSVLRPAYTREQEAEADELAIDLMIRAAYNHNAAFEAIKVLGLRDEQEHAQRTAAQQEAARGIEDQAAAQGPLGLFAQLPSIMATTISSALEEGVRALKSEYYPPQERLDRARRYVDRWHEAVAPPNLETARLKAFRERPATRQIFDSYAAAFEARDLLLQHQPAAARERATVAAAGQTRNEPFMVHLLAQLAAATDRPAAAMPLVTKALAAPHASPDLYLLLAGLHERQGQRAQADQTLQRLRTEFDELPAVLPILVDYYMAQNRRADAEALMVECTIQLRKNRDACNPSKRRKGKT